MFIIKKIKNKLPYKIKKATPAKSATVTASESPAIPTIDIQDGSGIKSIAGKMKTISLHSDGKKKFNKFISLEL